MNAPFTRTPTEVAHTDARSEWRECDDCFGSGVHGPGFRGGTSSCDNCSGEGGWTACVDCGEHECTCDDDCSLTYVERIAPGKIAA